MLAEGIGALKVRIELWVGNFRTNQASSDLKLLLGPGVLTTRADQHKRQRRLLNPVFSAGHLRDMTHIFYNVAHKVGPLLKQLIVFTLTFSHSCLVGRSCGRAPPGRRLFSRA